MMHRSVVSSQLYSPGYKFSRAPARRTMRTSNTWNPFCCENSGTSQWIWHAEIRLCTNDLTFLLLTLPQCKLFAFNEQPVKSTILKIRCQVWTILCSGSQNFTIYKAVFTDRAEKGKSFPPGKMIPYHPNQSFKP